uniref:Uncharacterized protein n=1 Tax=Parascaris equorum TaxID=6256 RepID=A0A914SA48_PAREQ
MGIRSRKLTRHALFAVCPVNLPDIRKRSALFALIFPVRPTTTADSRPTMRILVNPKKSRKKWLTSFLTTPLIMDDTQMASLLRYHKEEMLDRKTKDKTIKDSEKAEKKAKKSMKKMKKDVRRS